ncbi:MAG: hypothetical protein RKE50_12965 [Pseudohaliea sp.]
MGKAEVNGPFNDVARRFNLHRTGPRARDYSLRMVWSPERRTALYLGANHGRPHRLNDVWEFDLCEMQWILLYAPDNPRDYLGLGEDPSDVVLKDGVLQTRRGGPAVIGHTWSGVTYDSDGKRLLWMNTWVTNRREAAISIGLDPGDLAGGLPLWSFDPKARRWSRLPSIGEAPRSIFGGLLQYVPAMKGAVWHGNNWQMRGTWLYDLHSGSWLNLEANSRAGDFSEQAPTREQVAYLDSERQMIVAQQGTDTYEFNIELRSWRHVLSKPAEAQLWPIGHDSSSAMFYDPGTRMGLLIDYQSNHLWRYDPATPTWEILGPIAPPMPDGAKRLAFIDEYFGVVVVIEDREVWVYRPKRGRKADR